MISRHALLDVFILAAALFVSTRYTLAAEDQGAVEKSKPAAASVADQIAAIEKAFNERESKFMDELRAAKHDMPKVSDANQRYRADSQKLFADLSNLLKDNGDDPAAFDGILYLVRSMRVSLDWPLVAIIKKHHLENPKIGQLCAVLGETYGGKAWAEDILTAVVRSNATAAVRGQATLSLGDYYRQAALWDPYAPYRKQMPEIRVVPDEQKEQRLAKARSYYDAVGKEFADLESADKQATLGEKAKWQLARLDNLPNLKVGKPAPPIVGEDLDGRTMKLDDFRGKVTLLVFWGSWCGSCMAMVPHEQKLYKRLQDKPFVVVGVNCGDDRDKARETVKKREMAWRHWWDRGGTGESPIQIAYDVQHFPTVFVLDRAGIIRYIDPEGDKLDDTVDALLKEP